MTFLLSLKNPILPTRIQTHLPKLSTMSTNFFNSHAFAGNPIKLKTPKSTDPFSPSSALNTLKTLLLGNTHEPHFPDFKILPFRKGRPLAGSVRGDSAEPNWCLGWLSFGDCKAFLKNSEVNLSEDNFVYLGSDSEGCGIYVVYWAIDVTEADSELVKELGARQFCFVELRTLMVATDWENASAMGQLAIAGHAKSLLEWHTASLFCGFCGGKNILIDAGRRRQCSNELCKKKMYPRVDPVVIMLVIDKENDRVLLSRQSRFVPRMWSCIAGFMEPGESLEEAVRRETWEETGIEVGQVVYHSSQPWPVGPSSMPCQLMVGFYAYAKSLDINVDKEELEDAKWHSREDVKKALTVAEYKKAQKSVAGKVDQMCKGVERGQSLSTDFNLESGELAPMFIPGPFAIANHLISSWVNGVEAQVKQLASSFSNL
ncbi:Nudix hydrolase 19, chloroplastic [Capsicum baccatum]|uniref:NAD(+) diphosphatase n=1 Tax=Capsicum baccatum TaxID=33114 RepID=A0A2G2WNN0_CAPBA|nr:Nudix hydrolase 19, chloroplastic [Capsicum baccatum]